MKRCDTAAVLSVLTCVILTLINSVKWREREKRGREEERVNYS
jgi:hypothetical protein